MSQFKSTKIKITPAQAKNIIDHPKIISDKIKFKTSNNPPNDDVQALYLCTYFFQSEESNLEQSNDQIGALYCIMQTGDNEFYFCDFWDVFFWLQNDRDNYFPHELATENLSNTLMLRFNKLWWSQTNFDQHKYFVSPLAHAKTPISFEKVIFKFINQFNDERLSNYNRPSWCAGAFNQYWFWWIILDHYQQAWNLIQTKQPHSDFVFKSNLFTIKHPAAINKTTSLKDFINQTSLIIKVTNQSIHYRFDQFYLHLYQQLFRYYQNHDRFQVNDPNFNLDQFVNNVFLLNPLVNAQSDVINYRHTSHSWNRLVLEPWFKRLLENHFQFLKPSNYAAVQAYFAKWDQLYDQNRVTFNQVFDEQKIAVSISYLITWLADIIKHYQNLNLNQKLAFIDQLNQSHLFDHLPIINDQPQIDLIQHYLDKISPQTIINKFNNFPGQDNLAKIKRNKFNISLIEGLEDYFDDLILTRVQAFYQSLRSEISPSWQPMLKAAFPHLITNYQNYRAGALLKQLKSSQSALDTTIYHYLLGPSIATKNNNLIEGNVKDLFQHIKSNYLQNRSEPTTLEAIININDLQPTKSPFIIPQIVIDSATTLIPITTIWQAVVSAQYFSNCSFSRNRDLIQKRQQQWWTRDFDLIFVSFNHHTKQYLTMIHCRFRFDNEKIKHISVIENLQRYNEQIPPSSPLATQNIDFDAIKTVFNEAIDKTKLVHKVATKPKKPIISV